MPTLKIGCELHVPVKIKIENGRERQEKYVISIWFPKKKKKNPNMLEFVNSNPEFLSSILSII